MVGEIVLDRIMLPPFGTGTDRSQRKTCMRMGTFAWRCNESFWLRETVSKHRTAPVGETIHGRTFWLEILDTTKSLHSLVASLYRLLRPDLEDGASSSPSMTDDM